jgi:ribosomal protein L7/L12
MPAFNEALIGMQFQRVNERLRAIEEQLAVLSEKAGVPYERPGANLPEDVVELAKAGKELEAVKRYRELTGADAREAQEVVAGI